MTNGRKAFLETLTELAEKDPKVILIIGDVGFSFVEEFKKRFPNQYLNTGVCEQSMMGIACGLARAGWKPYVYTMINFIVFRPFEQVRNDIAYSNGNVKLFGVEGSAAYRFLGYSHNISKDEDIHMLQKLPNITTYVASSEQGIKDDMKREYERNGPAYFRI